MFKEYFKNVGIEFKVARIRKGLSCQEVSELAKLSMDTICRIENGTDGKLSTYKRVADALGVPLRDIL